MSRTYDLKDLSKKNKQKKTVLVCKLTKKEVGNSFLIP